MRSSLAALVVAASVTLAAQPQPPTFRGGTDLVEIDVVVHDRQGNFVGDLSPGDFSVEEGGRPQPIEQFYIHAVDGTSRGLAPLAPSDFAVRSTSRVFVVVFDDAHLTPPGFKRTQAAAFALFSQQFRPGDVGGVVTRGRLAQDRFTSDRDELLKAVKDAKPDSSKSSRLIDERTFPRMSEIEAVRIVVNDDRRVLEEVVRRACADDEDLCRRVDPEPQVRGKAASLADSARAQSARTLQLLGRLISNLTRFDGRKTLLLMSEGFVAEDAWPLVEEVVTVATRANVRLYTLDARGLDKGMASVNDAAPTAADTNARMLAQMDFGDDSINGLAVDTGGFVVRNVNQFDKAIARIVDDVNNYYVLGYRPAAAPDGKFHRVTVKVNRRGVAVRARRGYVAVKRPAAVSTETAAPPAAATAAAESAERVERATPPVEVSPPAASAEAFVMPHVESNAGGVRIRPDSDALARQLASPAENDADASAGWDAYQRGDVEAARARLTAAAARPDAPSWVHYTLGISRYALAQYRDAAASWERVRALAPDFVQVYFDLVDAYMQLKEHDRAIRIARLGLEHWPQNADLFEALGVVQTSRGSLDDAIKSFQAAVAIAPNDPTGYFNLGKARELRYFRSRRYVAQLRTWVANQADHQAAIESYERYLALNGPYVEAAQAGLSRLKWTPTPK